MGAAREREEDLMPQDNVRIARSMYDHWNERQFDKVAELMADDGEIVLVGLGHPLSRTLGPDRVLPDVGGRLPRRPSEDRQRNRIG